MAEHLVATRGFLPRLLLRVSDSLQAVELRLLLGRNDAFLEADSDSLVVQQVSVGARVLRGDVIAIVHDAVFVHPPIQRLGGRRPA